MPDRTLIKGEREAFGAFAPATKQPTENCNSLVRFRLVHGLLQGGSALALSASILAAGPGTEVTKHCCKTIRQAIREGRTVKGGPGGREVLVNQICMRGEFLG